MKVGAEPRKVAFLAALLIVGLIVLYFNEFAGDSDSKSTPRPVAPVATSTVAAPPVVSAPSRTTTTGGRRRTSNNVVVQEFVFRQGVEPGADKPDPATIDPTLRLDLLAKLQQVEMPASMRNIFQYGAASPPPSDPGKSVPLPAHPPTIAIAQPPPKPPVPTGPPPAPTAPQVTWKYYGYKVSKSDGRKQAFLLDGEDIIIAGENDSVKLGRYKVVRIGVNSITIEDTQFKSTQTLQLQPDAVA